MDNIISWGIHLSVLAISVVAIFRILYSKVDSTLINIIIIHIDENNNYISNPTYKYSFEDDIISLDMGYKLNHYQWNRKRKILVLFVKPAHYESIINQERIRKIILPDMINPIILRERYK